MTKSAHTFLWLCVFSCGTLRNLGYNKQLVYVFLQAFHFTSCCYCKTYSELSLSIRFMFTACLLCSAVSSRSWKNKKAWTCVLRKCVRIKKSWNHEPYLTNKQKDLDTHLPVSIFHVSLSKAFNSYRLLSWVWFKSNGGINLIYTYIIYQNHHVYLLFLRIIFYYVLAFCHSTTLSIMFYSSVSTR